MITLITCEKCSHCKVCSNKEQYKDVLNVSSYCSDFEDKDHFNKAISNLATEAKSVIEEMVDIMFDGNESKCRINNCTKPSSIPCESRICIDENKAFWNERIDNVAKKILEE